MEPPVAARGRTVAAEASPVPCENLPKIRLDRRPAAGRRYCVLGGADRNREAIMREVKAGSFRHRPLLPSPDLIP